MRIAYREWRATSDSLAIVDIETGINGRAATKTAQVARCGNSVCPQVVEAIVTANLAA